jgi:transcriptional regulator with PAS, ATPase and Fis domain
LEGIARQRLVVTLEAVRSYQEQRELGFGGLPPSMEVPASLRKRPGDLTGEDLRRALEKHQGNKTRAAAELGIALNTLKDRMKKFGIA